MKFRILKETLLEGLVKVNIFVYNNPKLPVLNNILLDINKNRLKLISSNLETEIILKIFDINFFYTKGSITIPSRKFLNICKSLPKKSLIMIELKNNRVFISSGKTKFFLSTLPFSFFPFFSNINLNFDFEISQYILKSLIEFTRFAIAQNDARYYLNGMFLKIENRKIQSVASNGHRLATYFIDIDSDISYSIIIPKKSVFELYQILNTSNSLVKFQMGKNKIRIFIDNYIFTSKLIQGDFPDFQYIISKKFNINILIDYNLFKNAISRVIIISNKQFCNIKLKISNNQLSISTNNSISEEAEEIIDILYSGLEISISLNAIYLIDMLNIFKCKIIQLSLIDEISSVKICDIDNKNSLYIIMPINL